jgi:DNA repair exonuclease SbcCD ATPase subunit
LQEPFNIIQGSTMQQRRPEMGQEVAQLHAELRKVRDERDRAHRVLEVTEWKALASANDRTTIETLEAELDASRESEKRMLDSLALQTKQLATPRSRHDRDLQRVHGELRMALAAEEKSRKAMEEFVMALKEVNAELHATRQQLALAQHEAEAARMEADRVHVSPRRRDDRLRAVSDEPGPAPRRGQGVVRGVAGRGKEAGFTARIKASEAELADARRESARLHESQRSGRAEVSKLRDILRQAVKDTKVVKEALEEARGENAMLKAMLGDKDKAVKCTRQELENLRVSEAAARNSVRSCRTSSWPRRRAPPQPWLLVQSSTWWKSRRRIKVGCGCRCWTSTRRTQRSGRRPGSLVPAGCQRHSRARFTISLA